MPSGVYPRKLSNKKCFADGCTKPQKAKGLCHSHYNRWKRYGDPLGGKYYFDGRSSHPLYDTWDAMMNRCYRKGHPKYHNYGGRGITVCENWRSDFWAFAAYMPPKPTLRHTIDRIKNDKGYEPGNVKWSTYSEQNQGRRKYIRKKGTPSITAYGKTVTAREWSKDYGVSASVIFARLKAGWIPEDAVSTPIKQYKRKGR